jgi:hypothetical protein
MRIVLVAIHPYPSPQAVPLANAFLSGYLGKSQLEIILDDYYVAQDAATCAGRLAGLQPAAVGLSMYVWNRSACAELARELKIRLPGLIIFAGGPEATADPQGVMESAPFDFVIHGEGEKPFAAVCERLLSGRKLDGVKGLVIRGNEGLILTTDEPLVELDTIPSPYLTGILDTADYKGILWQLSRGCGFACDFCFDSRDGHGVRRFSLERIEAELRHFAATGVSQVFVLDSTFNQETLRAKKILRLIKQIAPDIHFHFEVRSEFINREMARLFAGITCSLQIGLQSSNPQILRGVGRALNRDSFSSRIALLNETGAVFGLDLMYGLPGDTPQGFAKSLDYALGLYPNQIDIFPLAVLPGTALAKRSNAIGLYNLPVPPYTLISSPTYTAEQMAESSSLANACNIFYNRGKAVAWFNGVITALGSKPSAFLQQFAEWLVTGSGQSANEASLDDHAVWQLQRSFLTKMFDRKSLRRLLPVVLDLVDYHYHYAAALLTPQTSRPGDKKRDQARLLDHPCCLAPSTRLAGFHYQIYDLLEAGEPAIREFADCFEPTGSWVAIYPLAGEIRTESIAKPYFRLLEQLDGHTPTGKIAARLHIPAAEARSFLEFAFAEGIIKRC